MDCRRADVVWLDPRDNVVVAARDLAAAETFVAGSHRIPLRRAVPLGHKIAIAPLAAGEAVFKFGHVIGFASEPIEPGEWVHSHNLSAGVIDRNPGSTQCGQDRAAGSGMLPPPRDLSLAARTFLGYRRASGKSGTRNYLAIISSVNCSASVSRAIARRFDAETLRRDFPNIDGVVAFTHGGGCGMQYGGLQHQILNRVLGGIAKHPNIGGYVLLGLGCETGTIGHLLDDQRLVQIDGIGAPAPNGATAATARRPPVLSIQDFGGTHRTIEAGVRLVAQLLPRANDVRREPVAASEIILGTNCGGSDGNSGITANPALGVAADMLVAAGGTVILGETSEIYGAEQLLTCRARNPQVAEKLLEKLRWWEWYAGVFGAVLDNNPSPGNKAGGLTTIYEKSLGAVAKGGSTELVEVYPYAAEVDARGLVVMDTPGLDPVSVTGIVAGGANIIVFTTGRGSCFGCKPTPSIKVASNTPLYRRMIDDMDLDAGRILAGCPVADVGREIFEEILAVASGKSTKSEQQNLGDEEFVPWTLGPVL
ncbi:MAG TPA: altronate dehydratase family protein [Pirellulales bacterium]|nr:altronate dehydratase family protein [Pirellulales bacterium]